jgi:hypothetical protein
VKPSDVADGANDNGGPEDRLVLVTLAVHTILNDLAAPIELLVEALTFEPPVVLGKP